MDILLLFHPSHLSARPAIDTNLYIITNKTVRELYIISTYMYNSMCETLPTHGAVLPTGGATMTASIHKAIGGED